MRLSRNYQEQARLFCENSLLLLEMNVSNIDDIRSQFSAMLDQAVAHREAPVPQALRDLIIKRAVKAMGNDDAGNMTTRAPVSAETAPENAPGWLRTALQRGDEVWSLAFKDGFEARLAHVVDWMAADPQAARVVKAAPEADFLGHLGVAADQFFEKQVAGANKREAAHAEEGRVVILTFRLDPAGQKPVACNEDSLAPDQRGPVVAFWCRLDTPEALNREGKVMQHCVGSYANMVEAEQVVIYSLRDAQNNPHCTVELDQRRGAPRINQIKGKNNKPPIGKYSGYIRDFLNDMGVEATRLGSDDLRGVGLLTHGGKYGTILDVGGNIVHTFGNGDSLRYIDAPDEHRNSWSRASQPLVFMYVERDGTVPFEFNVNEKDKRTIASFKLLRKETSRFATYEKNLIALFNQDGMTSGRDTFQQIGVFFDTVKNRWGTKDDLSEHLFDYKGFQVSRFGTDVWFFHDNVFAASFFIPGKTLDVPSRVKIENDTPGLTLLPEAFEMFLNKYVYDDDFKMSDLSAEQKDMLYKFGVFPRKNGLGGVPDKQQVFASKHGSVRHFMHRFYFYDTAGKLLGICYLGSTQNNEYPVKLDKVEAFGDANTVAIYRLLSDLTHDESLVVRVETYNRRPLVERGFTIINSKLVPLSEVEKEKTLKDGYSMEIKALEHGGRHVMLKQGGRQVAGAKVDDKNKVEDIWVINEGEQRYYRNRKSSDGLEKLSTPLAAMLNAAGVVMRRRDMLRYFLNVRNGKFVPVSDPVLIQFMQGGKIDLGKGFKFVTDGDYARGERDERRWEASSFGRIEHQDRDHATVVDVKFADGRKDDLLYHMRKLSGNDGFSRDDVIKASAHLMKLFHDKVEPYLSNDWVGSAPPPVGDEG